MTRRAKTCAWISRHKPTKPQRRELEQAGYKIVQVNPPGRPLNAHDAWYLSQLACKGIPDLCVVVLPLNILKYFLRLTAGQTTVVQAPAKKVGPYDHDWEWTGEWREVHRVKLVTSEWRPG